MQQKNSPNTLPPSLQVAPCASAAAEKESAPRGGGAADAGSSFANESAAVQQLMSDLDDLRSKHIQMEATLRSNPFVHSTPSP
jgi:hypothetical protein